MKKTIFCMMITMMTVIGTTASFGNTANKNRKPVPTCQTHNGNCNPQKHNCASQRYACNTTSSTYCKASSSHKHKTYKNSNRCKYCKLTIVKPATKPSQGHRTTFR